mgnify:CR=1 FL=1
MAKKNINPLEAFEARGGKICNLESYINSSFPVKFIKRVDKPIELSDNQYYALVVTDNVFQLTNPHVEAVDTIKKEYYVGIERFSDARYYFSKNFYSRKDAYRGVTIVVEFDPEIFDNYILLK